MGDLSYLPTDTSGEPCRFLNHYRCDACDEEWSDRWSCACDDDCPACGASISPFDSDEEEDEDAPGADHERSNRDHAACDCCGRIEHIDLLDAKPPAGGVPETADWSRLECIACYGPGWLPMEDGALRRSINNDLHGLYLGFRLKRWLGECWRRARGLAIVLLPARG
ncbi:hypothetical protein [Bosea minatitlanensis]|uniref:DUF1963 domain-containing protein n=1 Tax=Bosea minatitlanensis TaxID=128782 RepID=A0ABW0F4E3_9HYPH|nr:hypothetical protein [Bosea minatitlanensis]MCT4492738.1 hypothetical protein [Bosea minatitlanensis]